MRLLRPDPLGELTALPHPLAELGGERGGREAEVGEEGGEMKKGVDPQCLKCVDAKCRQ